MQSSDPAVHAVLGIPTHRPPTPNAAIPITNPAADAAAAIAAIAPPHRPHPPSHTGPVIVWFRGHDLRVHDHAALDAAVATDVPVVALYVLERGAETDGADSYMERLSVSRSSTCTASTMDTSVDQPPAPRPLSPNGGFALGRVQRWYLHHSLCALRAQLLELGVTLILRRVDCAEDTAVEVVNVAASLGAMSVFWNKRYKPRAYPVDDAARRGLENCGIVTQDFCSETLMAPSVARCGRYDDFQSYTRFWIDAMRAYPPPRPNSRLDPAAVKALPCNDVLAALLNPKRLVTQVDTRYTQQHTEHCPESAPSLSHGFMGKPLPSVSDLELLEGLNVAGVNSPGDISSIGCVAAQHALKHFLQQSHFERFSSGNARRDGMVVGKDLATSRLSPHVRFGEISPRVLFYSVVDAGARAKEEGNIRGLGAARTFVKNMSLREFGYYMLGRYPEAACKPIMPEFEVFPWARDEDGSLMHSWETGTTGFPIVDAAMRQLIGEGWIHNRMRFLAASFFCKYLLLPWPVGAAHMVRTLVDGDEACNSLGWQWTAGCNSDSFPFSTLVNPLSLQNHTQSTKTAANYIRKYVPELACLPDHLVFSPWKATEEQKHNYNFSVVPRQDFMDCNSKWSPSMALSESPYRLYPSRIVNGRDARLRTRNAMWVMRRIFVAQRQIRPVVTDESAPADGFVIEKPVHALNSRVEDPAIVTDLGTGTEILSELTIPSSRPSHEDAHRRSIRARADDCTGTLQCSSPLKRRRVSTATNSSNTLPSSAMSVSHISSTTSEVSRYEADLLLSSSQIDRDESKRCLRRTRKKPVPFMTPVTGDGCSEVDPTLGDTLLKRPRASPGTTRPNADERLSVKSLLTPNSTVVNGSDNPSTVQKSEWRRSEPTRQRQKSLSGNLPKLPSRLPAQTLHPRSGRSSTIPKQISPILCTFAPDGFNPVSAPSNTNQLPHCVISPALSPVTRTAIQGYERSGQEQFCEVRPNFGNRNGMASVQELSNGDVRPEQRPRYDTGPSSLSSSLASSVFQMPQSSPKSQAPHPTACIPPHPIPNRMFGHSAPHSNLLPDRLSQQQQQQRDTQMIMAYRHQGGHLPLPHMHQPGNGVHNGLPSSHVHGHDNQRFFTVPAVRSPTLRPQDQQPMWHPAMSTYVGMQVPGIHNGHVPHMLHHIPMQPFANLPGGYSPSGTGIPIQTHESVMQPPVRQQAFPEVETAARRGPSTPMEREEIARRMAAMDYYDVAHGGKHSEQWQAIALHLLEQYEFSEDTDRETSKAYVRLCVLKDELRDANPSGPRVTVNHCKEVFRILCLQVTGEWDRRGHGGVRGPYCYGCVKRSGV